MDTCSISNSHMRVEFEPRLGGLLSKLMFHHPDKGWVDLFVTPNQDPSYRDEIAFYGCFFMLPFANRLHDGILKTQTHQFEFPIGLKAQNLAIHGTGWSHPWSVKDLSETSMKMVHQWENPDRTYAFEGELSALLTDRKLSLTLTLRNLTDHKLPMGMGFHPWFPDIQAAQIRFNRDLAANQGSPWSKYPKPGFRKLPHRFCPADYIGLDSAFDGWDGTAEVRLADRGVQVKLQGQGATDKLHVFVMGKENRFCLEPISHFPGDLNSDTHGVAPGDTISGTMVLTCESV